MGKLKDLTGQTFGRLRVIEKAGVYRPPGDPFHREITWRCLCDPELGGCGRETNVIGHNLYTGKTRSCGCLRTEKAASRIETIRKGRKT